MVLVVLGSAEPILQLLVEGRDFFDRRFFSSDPGDLVLEAASVWL